VVALAQRAVALAPRDVNYRKLLATAYLEAGLLKNAKREIDAAEQLAPQDDSIAALARRLTAASGRGH
jgi:Flp pilus assembly protein TadD